MLSHPRYDCPVCIQFGNHKARNCTGGPLIYHDTGVSIDRRSPPRAIARPDRPAYRDGWADVSREASELGIKGFAEAFSGPDYFAPIDHCLRLYLATPGVVEWLRLYAAIAAGLRTPPTDAPPWYDRIMLAIHGAVTAHRGVTHG